MMFCFVSCRKFNYTIELKIMENSEEVKPSTTYYTVIHIIQNETEHPNHRKNNNMISNVIIS